MWSDALKNSFKEGRNRKDGFESEGKPCRKLLRRKWRTRNQNFR